MDDASGPPPTSPAHGSSTVDVPLVSILVDLQTASVPGFAPLGVDADEYRRHRWGPDPMPEVVAHGQTDWPGVHAPSDFLAHLDLDRFDPPALVALAVDAGADQVVVIARDRDGVAWWPVTSGPTVGRDVVGELATATRDAGLAFGVAVSPDDASGWSADDRDAIASHCRPDSFHVLLPRQSGPHGGYESSGHDGIIAAHRTLPPETITGPWELRLGYGPTAGYNHLEGADDLRSTAELCDLVAQTAARGGTVLLDLPVDRHGIVPDHHQIAARQLGIWLHATGRELSGATAYDVADDHAVRFLVRPETRDGRRELVLVDTQPAPTRTYAYLSSRTYPTVEVRGVSGWQQDAFGLHLEADPLVDSRGATLPTVAVCTIDTTAPHAFSVRGRRSPGTVHIGEVAYPSVTAALTDAVSGDVVTLGPGVFSEREEVFPLRVGAGVTLQGPPPMGRPTALGVMQEGDLWTRLEGVGKLVELCGDGATLRQIGLDLLGDQTDPLPALCATGVADVTVESCQIRGTSAFTDVSGMTFRWNRITTGAVTVRDGSGVSIMGVRVTGTPGGLPAFALTDIRGLRLEACSARATAIGIHLRDVVVAQVGANAVDAVHTAIEALDGETITLSGNRVAAMRGVWLRRCHDVSIQALSVVRCDSALGVFDSTDVTVSSPHVARTRIGVFTDDDAVATAVTAGGRGPHASRSPFGAAAEHATVVTTAVPVAGLREPSEDDGPGQGVGHG